MWSLDWQLSMGGGGGGGGEGGDDGQKSQFHSLFFTQAAVIANNICVVERHSN